MSKWYDYYANNASLDREMNCVDILIDTDDFGNNYLSISFNDIESIYNKIKEVSNEQV